MQTAAAAHHRRSQFCLLAASTVPLDIEKLGTSSLAKAEMVSMTTLIPAYTTGRAKNR